MKSCKKVGGRTEKAILNISYNIFNQIITLLLAFVSRTVFIQGFGVGYLGINGLFSDILNLLSMADLGFNTAMTYSFYKPLAEKDHNKIAKLTSFYKKVYNTIALMISVIGMSLIPFLPRLVKLDYAVPNLTIYYLLSLSSVVVSYLCMYKTTILSADQKGYIITKVGIVTNTIKTILQIISIILFQNYIIYLLIGTVIAIGNNIYASYLAAKQYPYIIGNKGKISKEEKKSIFSNLGSVFLYKVSSVLLNATDNILISTIVGTAMVGYYSNYLMLQSKITVIISLFFTSMTAGIGNLIATEGEKKRYEIFQCEQSISFIICGVVVPCYVLLVDDFIYSWLGKSYQLGFGVTCAIGLNMYLSCVLQPLWSYREATGLYKKTKWVMVICAIFNIVGSILLGQKLGIFGIIIASGISRISTYVWYEPQLLFREYFGVSATKYYIRMMENMFLIICTITIGTFMSSFWNISGWWMWIIKALAVGCLSLIIVLGIYKNSDGVQMVQSKVSSLMKNLKR